MLNCSRPFICRLLMASAVALTSVAAAAAPEIWPTVSSAAPKEPRVEARIADLLQRLTLEQKVAQMVQADIRYVTPEDVKKYRLGAVLNGGGAFPGDNKHAAVADWIALADRFYDASMDTSPTRSMAITMCTERRCFLTTSVSEPRTILN